MTMYRALEQACSARPWHIEHAGEVITASTILTKAGQIASSLNLGLGVRVCVQVEKSVDVISIYIACLRVGAILIPLNTDYTGAELAYLIEDADPDVIICSDDAYASVRTLSGNRAIFTLSHDGGGTMAALQQGELAPVADVPPDTPAAMIYTSGTTGRPKGAVLTHENLLSNANSLINIWDIRSSDRLIHALPLYHVHGLFVALNPLMLSGASILLMGNFSARDVCAAMPSATLLMGVPTFYARLLDVPSLRAEAHSMRLFISGSAPLSPEVHRRFHEQSGHIILERYGMSETGMISSNPLAGDRRAGTVGFPVPGVEIRIVDPDTGAVLPPENIGSVEVRGPNVFQGYWRSPQKSAQSMRQGFFITGDMGLIDADGYLQLVGRSKDLIITGGLNVYPAEVEGVLDALPGVAESAVIGVPHADFGEAIVAVVATANSHVAPPTEGEILLALRTTLARFKRPKRIVFVERLPRNAMGKVVKASLRDRYANLMEGN